MTVNFTNVSRNREYFNPEFTTNQIKSQTPKVENNLKNDSFESSLKGDINKKIGFKEGVGLFAKGFTTKIKNLATSIIKHPIKTAGIILASTALLSALPLIGISTVAAGSALALLYAGIAVGKTTAHTIQFIKNNKNENYTEARKNLEQMGGDTVDLALTLPFVPKAVKNIKDFAKFGKIGINHELINEIKNSQGIKAKFNALKAGNFKITEDVNFKKAISKIAKTEQDVAEYEAMRNLSKSEFVQKAYEKMTKDMGISEVAPEPQLVDDLGSNMLGGFQSSDCSVKFNAQAFEGMKQSEILNVMRHELEHFRQYTDIARYKGADFMYELESRAYVERIKRGDTGFNFFASDHKKFIEQFGEEEFIRIQTSALKSQNAVNIEAYQKVIDKLGVIPEGSADATAAAQYIDAHMRYPDLSFSFFGGGSEYTENLLEVNARNAGNNPEGAMGIYKKAAESAEKTRDTYYTKVFGSVLRGNSAAN